MILTTKSFLIILFYFSLRMHPIHVSICNLEYFKKDDKMELSIKVFKDDFRLLFSHLNQKNIDFNDSTEINNNISLIKKYIENKLLISVNGNLKKTNLLKYSLKDDAIWFYYRIPINEEIITIKILNTVLLDLYLDQKNLLIFKAEDFEKGYQFDLKHNEYFIEF